MPESVLQYALYFRTLKVEFLHPMCETLAYTTSGPRLGEVGKEQFFKMSEPVRLSQLQVLGAGA